MSDPRVSQTLLSLHFNNSLVQPFLVFLSIPLNDFFSSGKEHGSQKVPRVGHLSLEFYRADVQIGVSQHLGLFLLLNGRKRSTFRKLNLNFFALE